MRQLLRQLHHRLIVKIAATDMEKLAGLLFNSLNYPRMRMTCIGNGDTGHEVEEQITVDVFDHTAAPLLDDQRINTAVCRRSAFLVALNERFGLGTGEERADVRNFHLFSWSSQHGALLLFC